MPDPLPIDSFVDRMAADLRRARALVVTAAPGAGKTTRLPPALVADGPVILLQPRRVAARAIAARIAAERGWTLGREVGWQVRFDSSYTRDTRLLVVTEGVLTARLQSDPLLTGFTTIVLDEFHERSIHADLALALAKQAWRARHDLRLVVMSATLDSGAVSAFLDGCPVVDVPGRLHPVDIAYAPGQTVADACAGLLSERATGNLLCFMPGASEIRRAIAEIQARVPAATDVVPLHGSLDAGDQDAALRPSTRRRIIVATNIAETSLTVPGVTAVVDTGLQKVARYDPERGIDSLETERIPADAADQRGGRAGRLGPGLVRRLWDARDRLRPRREPDIHRIDLSAAALDIVAWGGDPRAFEWFEQPRAGAVDAALALLARLDLVTAGPAPRLTGAGDLVRRLPVHPRLARMLVAANGAREIAQACALLSERHLLPPRTASTTSDLLSAIDRWRDLPSHVQRAAAEIERAAHRVTSSDARGSVGAAANRHLDDGAFRRAILAGYPDRVARRRQPGSAEMKLASGAGAVLAVESGVREGEYLVALDVQASSRPHQPNALVRLASLVDRDWLEPTASSIVHRLVEDAGVVRAVRVDRYDALTLAEHPAPIDPEIAAQLLAEAWLRRGPREDDERLVRRLRFIGHGADLEDLVRSAARGARSLDDVRLVRALPPEVARTLERDAPEMLSLPSGRRARLDYQADGTVSAAVKLQELFGVAETPRIGRRREPVLLALLAPNGRPVQLTRDLRSFWDRTYPEVRRALRGRYPKHRWPEDPWA